MSLIHKFFTLVIKSEPVDARKRLFYELDLYGFSEAQFCNAILDHSTVLKYNAEQCFNFLSKVPNKILLSDSRIVGKLTPQQRLSLGLAGY
jgi:hypothetical protein